MRPRPMMVDKQVARIATLAMLVALVCGVVAHLLIELIDWVTNVAFFGRLTTDPASPADNQLGLLVIFVPAIGGLIVGAMAKWGSQAIRGHGIPEAMEQVLTNESRIPPKMTFLKPLSSAVAIGTGGPFGAEGPIIATGGALGSFVGQALRVTAEERKTLLAAGAAAGMAATFGTPVSAVLLAIELLLFEYRPRSVIPVALAACVATGVRIAIVGDIPVFPLAHVLEPTSIALSAYVVLGGILGFASVLVTRAVYWVEDGFEKLPIHWAFWPALGGLAVGVIGYFAPHTLGVGYNNIEETLTGELAGGALAMLVVAKFTSWAIALGSGTSGGTLAPLLTIGGGLGALVATGMAAALPGHAIDPRIGALVGMAAMFAGASRALLASVVFAFETTRQPLGLLPLLGGCSAAYFVSCISMANSIMTEKLARRGMRIPAEYAADFLDRVLVRAHRSSEVIVLSTQQTVDEVRTWMATRAPGTSHHGFPVVDADARLVGVLTQGDLLAHERGTSTLIELISREPIVVVDDNTLREACDKMVEAQIGRVIVVDHPSTMRVTGIVTRSDLLTAHEPRLRAAQKQGRTIDILGRPITARPRVQTS